MKIKLSPYKKFFLLALIIIFASCLLAASTLVRAQGNKGQLPGAGSLPGSGDPPNTGGSGVPDDEGGSGVPDSDSSFTFKVPNPLSCGKLQECLSKIIDTIFYLSIPVVTAMVLYGGMLIITGGYKPDNVTKGRKTILYAAVGFATVLLAQVVTVILMSIFA